MKKADIFKNGSTTFFYASIFFPPRIKADVFSLYAYVRVIDDLVDQAQPQTTQLELLWRETLAAWRGKAVDNEIVRDFVELAKRKKFEWLWIKSFWWAMKQDLVKKKYRNFAELEKYMYGSAEVVGLMMAQILDLPKAAQTAAQLQGKAMQLINFIRDVQEDVQLQRVYLPELKPANPSAILPFLKKYHQIQKQAERGYRFIPHRYLIPIKTAAQMYAWTANQIERQPGIIWQQKVKPKKIQVILTALKNSILI